MIHDYIDTIWLNSIDWARPHPQQDVGAVHEWRHDLRRWGQGICNDGIKELVLKDVMMAEEGQNCPNCVTAFMDDPFDLGYQVFYLLFIHVQKQSNNNKVFALNICQLGI